MGRFFCLASIQYISYVSLQSFMSSKLSVKELSFIYYLLFSYNSYNRCAIPDDDVDQDKVGLKVEDGKEKKKEDEDDLEVLDEEVNMKNDGK